MTWWDLLVYAAEAVGVIAFVVLLWDGGRRR